MFLGLTNDFSTKSIQLLDQCNKNIVNNNGTIMLLDNVCPHQNSRLKCNGLQLTCPYHGLEFDHMGLGMGHQYQLETRPACVNQGMVFSSQVDIPNLDLDFSNFRLVDKRIDSVGADAEIIMDVFLDIDHIPVAHRNVYDQIGITDTAKINYIFFEAGSVQWAAADFTNHIIEPDKKHNMSAVWIAVYPGTMIEWQAGGLFVTQIQKQKNKSLVHIYKYKDSRYSQKSWQVNQTVWETAWRQDKELSENIAALPAKNLPPLKQHFSQWLNDNKK